ncbi:hypothetical protein [Hydrogenophaga sp.]|jgi:hypothetical protein|uniref:hypothetical protein n=1 Tax=Hydrogenophaga sp. TaxID=1904254 RepID=UPI003F71CDA9
MFSRLLRLRLTWTLALLAWFTQLGLPVGHAAMQAAPPGAMSAWCGDPALAQEAAALLPPEIRDALAHDSIGLDHLATCAKLCAVGTTPALLPMASPAALLQATAAPLAKPRPATIAIRRHALPPPSHGPPEHA